MKVAYDISILGAGYANPKARTGVFRVVESLLSHLIYSQSLEVAPIALNAQSSGWDEISAQLYLETYQPQLQNLLHESYANRVFSQRFYRGIVQFQRTLIHTTIQTQPILYKLAQALRIPFDSLSKLFESLQFTPQSYDVYHCPYNSLMPQEYLGKLPRILTIYDLIPVRFSEFMTPKKCRDFHRILESIDRDRDWIICISQNTKEDFCNYTGMKPERVFVAPLAASSYFYPVTDLEIVASTLDQYKIPKTPYLLSVCTLEPRKNLSFLIRCFLETISVKPELELNLVLVGVGGWNNAEIFQIVEDNSQLKSRVIFTGYIPDNDLSAIYSGALAFVYPSLYEGFGLPPLEAMQCGVPVITSNTSALPEVVDQAGILINPKQEDELCGAILQVVEDAELRAKLSQKSIQQAAKFSWEKCAEQTISLYQIAANNSL
ncbi:MAG: glycosyltransferase family 1 protein [Leptolyngbyaceae cyanobacterium MO_188.B28]|nr:glycosyltransferase family 1 protein [Leptolyngbyaceae cyanobacterium MO_188.B28]